MLNLTIDGIPVRVEEGATVLEAARRAGVWIPTLCFLKGRSAAGSCRVCVVEVEGEPGLVAACNTPAREGMAVFTATPPRRAGTQDRPAARARRAWARLHRLLLLVRQERCLRAAGRLPCLRGGRDPLLGIQARAPPPRRQPVFVL